MPPRASMRSGRLARVRRSAAARRQRATLPWSPERSTSGTVQPRKLAGLVYCGYSSSPSAKLSSTALCVVAEHAVAESRHGLDDHECGELAAGEHDVADAQLAVAAVVEHALVDALVAPAQQREAAEGGELACDGLVESATRRREGEQRPAGAVGRLDGLHGVEDRARREHHAGAAAEGGVVDGASGIARVRAQVPDAQVDRTGRPRATEDRLAPRTGR